MSIGKQISNYKAAVGKRNVGNDPSAATMSKAQDTAIGRNRASSVTNNSTSISASSQNSRPRGSWEGYMHAPSAPIQIENTGYLAKAAQKARGSKPGMNLAGSTPSRAILRSRPPRSHKTFDLTHNGSKGSSISLLKNHMELNNLF